MKALDGEKHQPKETQPYHMPEESTIIATTRQEDDARETRMYTKTKGVVSDEDIVKAIEEQLYLVYDKNLIHFQNLLKKER
jgi:hypothetical protein